MLEYDNEIWLIEKILKLDHEGGRWSLSATSPGPLRS